jgi:hypothetical protein
MHNLKVSHLCTARVWKRPEEKLGSHMLQLDMNSTAAHPLKSVDTRAIYAHNHVQGVTNMIHSAFALSGPGGVFTRAGTCTCCVAACSELTNVACIENYPGIRELLTSACTMG